jgi:hypothetical protein
LPWGCQFVGLDPAGFYAIRLPEGEPGPFRLVAADLWRQYNDAFGPGRRDERRPLTRLQPTKANEKPVWKPGLLPFAAASSLLKSVRLEEAERRTTMCLRG